MRLRATYAQPIANRRYSRLQVCATRLLPGRETGRQFARPCLVAPRRAKINPMPQPDIQPKPQEVKARAVGHQSVSPAAPGEPSALKDQVKAFWNRESCDTWQAQSEKFSREYFEQIEQWRYRDQPFIHSFAQFTRYRGKRVLEVGFGAGTDSDGPSTNTMARSLRSGLSAANSAAAIWRSIFVAPGRQSGPPPPGSATR